VTYDHIIIGGGCAGLQLARALLHNPATSSQSVLILDATDAIPSKSWCFWIDKEHPYSSIVEKTWNKVDITAFGDKMIENILPLQYQYISSERFYSYHYDLFAQNPHVRRTTATVRDVASINGLVRVSTNEKIYNGKHVYDSRLPQQALPKGSLKQHFLGWFVQSEPPCFTPDTATLMDFDIADDSNSGFCYVLPFNEQNALVEMTFFTEEAFPEEQYKALLNQYLERHYPGTKFQITKQEVGQIPMTNFRFAGKESDNLLHIGTSAGMTKPSTGFTFMRILRDSEEIVRQVASGAPSIKKYRGSATRFHFYDTLLLGILSRKPQLLKKLMYQLFRTQPFRKVLMFLDERTHVAQEATIFARLPVGLFLYQVLLTFLKSVRLG